MLKYLSDFGIPVPASFSSPLVPLAVFVALLLKCSTVILITPIISKMVEHSVKSVKRNDPGQINKHQITYEIETKWYRNIVPRVKLQNYGQQFKKKQKQQQLYTFTFQYSIQVIKLHEYKSSFSCLQCLNFLAVSLSHNISVYEYLKMNTKVQDVSRQVVYTLIYRVMFTLDILIRGNLQTIVYIQSICCQHSR